jgi:ankyrin repeat protein
MAHFTLPLLPPINPVHGGQELRLLEAARTGDAALVSQVLEEGLDVNEKDAEGVTPLIMASAAGNVEAVRTLLAAGADVAHKDALGYDAYHTAMYYGDHKGMTVEPYREIMRMLARGSAGDDGAVPQGTGYGALLRKIARDIGESVEELLGRS